MKRPTGDGRLNDDQSPWVPACEGNRGGVVAITFLKNINWKIAELRGDCSKWKLEEKGRSKSHSRPKIISASLMEESWNLKLKER
jgi:hypothetical protein